MMDRFEKELSESLRREPAPEWLEEKILERVRQQRQPRKTTAWFSLTWLRFAGAMAALVVVVGGFQFEQARRERLVGERAKEQMLLALHVTGSKLRLAQDRVLSNEKGVVR